MLQLLAAVGGGLFVLASLVVGGRLIWMSRTTRGLPELVLGAALFGMGGIGYPMLEIAVQAKDLPSGARVAMVAVQMVTTAGGMIGMAWFTRHVFRPGAAWATTLWLSIVAMYAGLALWQILAEGLLVFLDHPTRSPWHIQTYVGVVVMTWSGAEALYYWRMQRRRLPLGLADPVVADRFRLWGLAILTADSISLITIGFDIAGVQMVGTAIGAVIIGFLGLIASASLGLAFLPPQSYLARVRRRAGSMQSA